VNLTFTRSFAKDLRQIRDTSVLSRLQEVIQEIETAGSIQDLKNLKNSHRKAAITASGWGTIAWAWSSMPIQSPWSASYTVKTSIGIFLKGISAFILSAVKGGENLAGVSTRSVLANSC
jgi:hypothetical protein